MSQSVERIRRYLARLNPDGMALEQSLQRMRQGRDAARKANNPPKGVEKNLSAEEYWARYLTMLDAEQKESILDPMSKNNVDGGRFNTNCENCFGTVKMPVGLAGPVRIHGKHANGDFYIPLATHEGALVASYSRGMQVLNSGGGVQVAVIDEGVARVPVFSFEHLSDTLAFMKWTAENEQLFREMAAEKTKHGKLEDIKYLVEGRNIHVKFDYHCGDAAGQNMVSFCTDHIFKYIQANSPVPIVSCALDGGLSSDKKASAFSHIDVRGKRVVAEATIPKDVVEKRLHTPVRDFVRYRQRALASYAAMGLVGAALHPANGLAAMYIACGQDAACVSESHPAVTKFEETPEGDLHVSITFGNIIVGSVGGGTNLPTQAACLDILGCRGAGKANKLAEIIATVCLAGEISLAGAISAAEWTDAHAKLGRDRTSTHQA
eukprot:Clim_evm48s147 gene=Clim_evmTU48s147